MRRLLIAFVLLMSVSNRAQAQSFYTDKATQQVNVTGTPTPLTAAVPYVFVRVCGLPLTQTIPCLPLASINDVNNNPLSNNIGANFGQLTTDVTGRWTIGCTIGTNYQVQIQQSASNAPFANYPITCPGALNGGLPSGQLNVKFTSGAKGDLRLCSDAVTNSTATVTSASCSFTSADQGKIAWVLNGSGGVICGTAATTVSTVNSGTSITLSTTCNASASSLSLYLGTNDYLSFQNACNAIPIQGAIIYIPASSYAVANSTLAPFCNIASSVKGDVTIQGEGQESTTTGLPNAGSTIFPAPWYTYNNGGLGDWINQTGGSVLHLWNFSIDGQNTIINISNQVLLGLSTPDVNNFMVRGVNVQSPGSAVSVINWSGDTQNNFYNTSIYATNAAGLACNGFFNTLVNNHINISGDFAIKFINGCGTFDVKGGFYSGKEALDTSGAAGNNSNTIAIHGGLWCTGGSNPAINLTTTSSGVWLSVDGADINGQNCGGPLNATGITVGAANHVFINKTRITASGSGNTLNNSGAVWQDQSTVQNTTGGAGITGAGTNHHSESGVCTFSASTTCAVTFAESFGTATGLSVGITPINPGAVTFTINSAPVATGFTITASGSNSLSVGWSASL